MNNMKYRSTTKAGNGNEVFEFTFNREELEIIRACLISSDRYMPEHIETQIIKSRIKAMVTDIGKFLKKLR